ncbi:DUF2169 domain-containing protein [Enterobacter soli]|uniref:DUF2169 domain-containing protein n=1 Tax=Enterobacter soli TaxID=885040 RepID=UPI0034CE048C
MEFRNLTPFSVMAYAMDDKQNKRHHVIAMKIGYRLVQDAEGQWLAQLMENPALPLSVKDVFLGEVNRSPVLCESDLAPFKPACDIIVNGTARAPGGIATSEMTAGICLRTSSDAVLLDKRLRITGQRYFRQQALTGQWYETKPEPFTSLRLDYRSAFGGECRVEADSEYAERVPNENRLTDAQRSEHPDKNNPPLAHAFCPTNPLGQGYSPPWYLDACGIKSVEAPRIIAVDAPFTLHHFTDAVSGKADWSAPAFRPAGFGVIGRTWLPRLPLAGTYDDAWLNNRHPALPDDFEFSYWNCAPQAQQLPFLAPGTKITLSGLRSDGDISFSLPASRAGILLRMTSGELIPQMMWTDTLLVDTDELTVEQTCRYVLPVAPSLRVMEARYYISGEL